MKRIPELDSIRGLAAITILLYHFMPAQFHCGWAAVDCFFVLSSYLITSILLEYRGAPGFFVNFYARRSIRIWPIYYLCLLGLVALNAALSLGESSDGLIYYLTYTQNIQLYWGQEPPSFNRGFAHTWTLALEEQYYILWPLVVYCCGRRALIVVSLLAAGTSIALRECGVSTIILAGRCDGFALGGLVAVVLFGLEANPAAQSRWARVFGIILIAATALLAAIISGILDIPMRIEYFSICFFGLIGFVRLRSGSRWLSFLRSPALVYFGAISYGLYLYHVPVDRGMEVFLRKIGIHHRMDVGYPIWRTAAEFAVVFVVAVLSWHFIEKPILELKSRFRYRGPTPAVEAS